MGRRRYRYNEATKAMEEISAAAEPAARIELLTGSFYADARATDGTPIDTRSRHAAYLKANDLAMASDFAGAREQRQKEKEKSRALAARAEKMGVSVSWTEPQRGRR